MAFSGDQIMLAHLGVKLAEPFVWGDEPQMTIGDVNKPKPLDSDAQLSGLDSLKRYVQSGDGDDDEEQILRSLFEDAEVDLAKPVPKPVDAPYNQTSKERMENTPMEDVTRDVPIKGLSDRAVAELTVESRTSLFGSILRLFDKPKDGEKSSDGSIKTKSADVTMKDASDSNKDGCVSVNVVDPMIMKEPILSTAEIVRSVHLTVRPGDIPAGMDSKEYTMAVLHFLASYVPHLHEDESEYRTDFNESSQEGWDQLRKTLPVLPLIKATNPRESLEMRCYGRVRPLVKLGQRERKRYPDSMERDEAFRRKVLNLERVYSSSLPFSSTTATPRLSSKFSSATTLSSPTKAAAKIQRSGNDLPFAFQRYVPRRKLLPHIEGGAKEELTLMISGHMQQPQHTPGPKPKAAKSKAAAPGLKTKATPMVKSTSPGGATDPTKPSLDKDKGLVDSVLTPSKRKFEKTADEDGILQFLSKKRKEYSI